MMAHVSGDVDSTGDALLNIASAGSIQYGGAADTPVTALPYGVIAAVFGQARGNLQTASLPPDPYSPINTAGRDQRGYRHTLLVRMRPAHLVNT